ncbi:sulfatase-like hydrolase/transferase [Puniceicoccus vermicola]|uniref:Sulfatase-like hydrolase/transferase n=1 Tax=Puniceicoccus vermicola TaxID=388746 RepID=A0A7X1B079_9BACT|nr:sulfatase-like hydrolase/transferase [Puniceicoccus vermicola]MBC2603177.1 sulfatase-like hydrolase/transferase [Puniceicoccus vermicola]
MSENKQPHVLLLISDQHRASTLSCAGDALVQTPALDSLAEQGVRLENLYCNNPICVPSRMSFMTSRYSHHCEVWDNSDSLHSHIPTFAHAFGLAGYRTVLCGRMHFVGGDQLHGFQERAFGDVCGGYLGTNRAEYRSRGFFGVRESIENAGPGPANDLAYDQGVTANACRIIRDHEETGDPRPLLLVVSWYSPHDPYRAYRKDFERHTADNDSPKIDPRGEKLHPLLTTLRARQDLDSLEDAQLSVARASYRAKVEFLDEQIGRVLEHWRFSSFSENQAVCYLSDHGEMLGDHGLWAKNCFYDPASKVPGIMVFPDEFSSGKTEARPASLVDITATLVDIAGAPPLPASDGQSLRDGLRGEETWPSEVLVEMIPSDGNVSRMIRRGKWKLNWYPQRDHEWELFDLENDPDELEDLSRQPEASQRIQELAPLLRKDEWSPQACQRIRQKQTEGKRYLSQWALATIPQDPTMFGIAAPL